MDWSPGLEPWSGVLVWTFGVEFRCGFLEPNFKVEQKT